MRLIAEFVVSEVVGLPRARVAVLPNGKVRHYNPATGDWQKEAIRAAFRKTRVSREPVEGGVVVQIVASRPLPVTAPKRREGEQDIFKPDADNVAKLVLDALNGLAWRDDSQIVDLHVIKRPRLRGIEPTTRVTIHALGESA